MVHAILDGLFTSAQAAAHATLIEAGLTGRCVAWAGR
jgi:hypothetical protein